MREQGLSHFWESMKVFHSYWTESLEHVNCKLWFRKNFHCHGCFFFLATPTALIWRSGLQWVSDGTTSSLALMEPLVGTMTAPSNSWAAHMVQHTPAIWAGLLHALAQRSGSYFKVYHMESRLSCALQLIYPGMWHLERRRAETLQSFSCSFLEFSQSGKNLPLCSQEH